MTKTSGGELRLPPQPWMSAPATKAVVAALTAGGSEVRFVGGCVRDALLGRAVTDIDIATPDEPARVIELLEAAGLKAVPTGIDHGTVTAVALHQPFEITTLRRDVESYGRRAKVAFTDDWIEDAARRDFTFNAMSCAPDGQLYDPFGGAADLEAKRVRFVGDAEARIREDVLRLLRFFRFYAHYGAPPPDAEALAAVERLAPLLPTLSGERIAAETLKLLAARDPAAVLRLMQHHGVLAHFLPEGTQLDRLARLTAIERSLNLKPEPPRRLAAVLESEAAARAVAARWHLSNALRDRLVEALTPSAPTPALDDKTRRVLRYELTAEAFRDRGLLAWAGDESARDESWRDLVALADWTPPRFPLRAQDALALGIVPGPALGEILREMERWWIEGDFRADRRACLAEMKRRVGGALNL
ncbi:MAG TPA: CCA tRNA nucleotidyltransferase [Verrucomicrobiae bacterium]|nr:CCA tRNA nucleotidyltransferase [Verrucomicrobiae bacterium]